MTLQIANEAFGIQFYLINSCNKVKFKSNKLSLKLFNVLNFLVKVSLIDNFN